MASAPLLLGLSIGFLNAEQLELAAVIPSLRVVNPEGGDRMKNGMSRRGFIATAVAAGSIRAIPPIATRLGGKRILTLVYDKSIGAMRAIDRLVR